MQTATSDMGPGTYTSMTQVAADALGLPHGAVRFALGDSRFPEGAVTFRVADHGQRRVGGVTGGEHVARQVRFGRQSSTRLTAERGGAQDVTVVDGRMFVSRRSRPRRDLPGPAAPSGWPSLDSLDDVHARRCRQAVLDVRLRRGVRGGGGRRGTGLRAGPPHLSRCYDAGRIVNPKLAHSQAIGGMVAGIGMALLEGTELDHRDGRIVNANMSDYLVPVNADVPALDAAFLPGEDTIADPIGVKGLGEIVIVGVPAAIANAVFNATGKRVTDLPITPRASALAGRRGIARSRRWVQLGMNPFTETERENFLAALHVAVLSVATGNERPPASVPIWYDYVPGGNIRINTGVRSRARPS